MRSYFFIIVILFSIFSKGLAQDLKFQNDSTFKKYVPNGLFRIDQNKLTGYQFQLRLYFGNGPAIIPKEYLLLITLKNKTWSTWKYTFTGRHDIKIDSEQFTVNNYKKLFRHLKKDGLFTQTTIDEDLIQKLAKDAHSKEIVIASDGGSGYKIELLSPNVNRGFILDSPAAYYDSYHLKQLKKPILIMKRLYKVMGMKNPG